MGLFDFFKKKRQHTVPQSPPVSLAVYQPAKKAELTKRSKEEIVVQRISLQDMVQFTSLPFVWNSEIHKVIGPSTQPYAFMDIVGSNVLAAHMVLKEMNSHLLEANRYIYPAYRIIKIPVDEVVFTPNQKTSYSKIICNPHTFTGRISKYPVSLLFMTSHVVDGDSTHGELFFDQTGKVGKARICFWREERGFFFFYKSLNGHLFLDRIETCAPHYENGEHRTIYKN